MVDGHALPSSTPVQISLARGAHRLMIQKGDQTCTAEVSVSALSARTFQCDLASGALHTVR
jgi:hypothetical protein